MTEQQARQHHLLRAQERRDAAVLALEEDRTADALHELGKMLKHEAHLHAEGSLPHEQRRCAGKGLLAWARILIAGD